MVIRRSPAGGARRGLSEIAERIDAAEDEAERTHPGPGLGAWRGLKAGARRHGVIMKHLESPETRTADAYHPRLHACTATRADGRHRNGVLLPARSFVAD